VRNSVKSQCQTLNNKQPRIVLQYVSLFCTVRQVNRIYNIPNGEREKDKERVTFLPATFQTNMSTRRGLYCLSCC